ncbi:adenylate/guanylate cyclase domain-containing protein [Sinorhizobium meliloti]|uniref:adenylate/guanylate cyclase domain-containing protein n=1 Tax=Rhizobium meliloti TaxID=382 RepID=UPI000FDBC7C7|nr:adenylate/guanylate cyclase domain-containing protein [Sinorhizobium meliloti]RVH60098.1 adenylate/guanylate cyclase domain-containing protein [Sinorhizobium meliloti]
MGIELFTDGTMSRSIWTRATHVPPHVPRSLGRYYIYWRFFYVLAGFEHTLSLIAFLQSDVTFMAIFNVFSVALFVAAFFLLKAGYYQTAYWSAITELVLHGIAATICIGPQFGFTNYTFLVVVLVFIQPFYSWRVSLVLAVLALASAAMVTAYALDNHPVYTLSEEWARTMIIRQVIAWPISVLIMVLPFIGASARAEKELAAAYAESERLLLNILPGRIAKRLKATSDMIADDRERVAILFADIVGFTSMSGRLPPAKVVALLNNVFNAIDGLVDKYGLEKIKTIGDAYMVAAGLPDPVDDPEGRIAKLALEIARIVPNFKQPGSDEPLAVRIGINSGRVVAGVIGNRKFAYDVWGDAVNVAARMEESGEPGRIQVTDTFAALLRDRFVFEARGETDIKGKGWVRTSFLIGEMTEELRAA